MRMMIFSKIAEFLQNQLFKNLFLSSFHNRISKCLNKFKFIARRFGYVICTFTICFYAKKVEL